MTLHLMASRTACHTRGGSLTATGMWTSTKVEKITEFIKEYRQLKATS